MYKAAVVVSMILKISNIEPIINHNNIIAIMLY